MSRRSSASAGANGHTSKLTVEIGVDAFTAFVGGDLPSALPVDVLELVLSSNHSRDALRPMA